MEENFWADIASDDDANITDGVQGSKDPYFEVVLSKSQRKKLKQKTFSS